MTNPEYKILDQANKAVFHYEQWRTAFLNTVLRVTAFLAFFLLLFNVSFFTSTEIKAFTTIYVVLLIFTFAPFPYTAKAGALIAAGYTIGLYTLIQFGPWSNALTYILGITLFASLLFDSRIDLWVFAINILTIITFGLLNVSGTFTLTSTKAPLTGLTDWLSYTVDFVVIGLALTWAINLLKVEFRSVANQFQSALAFLSKDRSELEKRVEERTAGLLKKTDQLRAVSFIARKTEETLDLSDLLQTVVNLVTDQFGFYHAGIFLLNEMGDEAVLQAASSEGGKRLINKGHMLKVGSQSIVGYAASQKKARIALDVGADAVFFNNPELPATRSEVALPLIIRNKVMGILDIQSDQPQAFNTDDIDVLQTLADQVAVALNNTRLLEDAQASLMQIEMLTAARTRDAWRQKLKEGKLTYTYTPLGIRTGKESNESDRALRIPITLRGEQIGAISVERKDDASWTDIDKDLIGEVAYQTGLAIDNVRLVEDATERARQEQTVGELATRFSQSTDIDNLLQIAARELGQVKDVAEVSVYIGQIPEQSPQKKRTKRISG